MITAPPGAAPVCACCGSPATIKHATGLTWPYRCEKHRTRNPCAVEGCARTREAPVDGGTHFLADDQMICADHWRRYVPPRSRVRRAYHAHFRRAKKLGRGGGRNKAFWRFWTTLVQMVRRRADSGHLDEAEINRLMGW